ncbi:hypothetical protein UR09_00585 [Candidatus Nitromaritima sp. SCGC AAA799-A02]|nr:hypothetical protein UR09_00585 [Candidatus Nitromaritima sp. SCGC AAA799-A02]
MSEHEEEQKEDSGEHADTGGPPSEGEEEQEGANLQESEADTAEEKEEEEVEFDLEAQVEEFRRQIEEEPENCVHHYNLGEALVELGQFDEAQTEFEQALELDQEEAFTSIIHFGLGSLYFHQLISGVQGTIVRGSVGLHSAHKQHQQVTEVNLEDYEAPIREFEAAIESLDRLKADEDIVDHVRDNAPRQIADTYYKWASDLIDKSRQLANYGEEIKDVKASLRYLKKTLEINPNHSQARLMVKYARKMLQEGWSIYDEYGFIAKEIRGIG